MMFEMCFYYNPRGGSRHYKWNNTDYTVGTAGVRRCVCASACDDFHYFCRGWQFPIIKCSLKKGRCWLL